MAKPWILRCYRGHFVAHARSAPPWFADAYCHGCKDWVPIDSEENCTLVAEYHAASAAMEEESKE